MKKILIGLLIISVFILNPQTYAIYKGFQTNVSKEEVIDSLAEITRLFNEHAKKMGGAGFRFGVKSKLMCLFTDSHRELLQDYLLRTPLYMLYSSGIKEDDPDLGHTFIKYCDMMPTVYDTYETCAKKIRLLVKTVYPGESGEFYKNMIERIRKQAGVTWL